MKERLLRGLFRPSCNAVDCGCIAANVHSLLTYSPYVSLAVAILTAGVAAISAWGERRYGR